MNQSLIKYVIIPITLFAASLVIVFWLLLPMWSDAKAALEIKKQNEINLTDRRQLSANLEKLVNQYNGRISDIALFEKSIPAGQNIPEILINLEALASENNLIFGGIEFKTQESKFPGVKTLVMDLKLKGSYPAFLNYLKAVEKSLRLFDVVSASFGGIGPGQAEAKINELEFNVKINTYYQ